ncbi:Uncharacterised protein [Amycolatopsis camponoti]|uniref:tRNA nuclease CdiA C-terminal domain-containing protein n=1 Tax=Amycolatopsis camponoti TaxID=2606593 RepID=A0A6I8M5S1_9PSEU|nr:Uncharacterised protein [Amycolatopsis camponoti]
MARIDDGGAPQGVVDVTPEDFHVVALGLAEGQEQVHQIRLKLFTALDGNAGAAGAGDGAEAFERGYQSAMHTLVAAFFRAYDVLGSVAAGIDQAGLNHWTADNSSHPQPGPAPWTPLLPPKAGGSPAWPGLLGPEEWWLPHGIGRYAPNADTGKLTNIQLAFEQAGDAVQALAADLKNSMFELVENNDSADIDALNDFWDRLAGGHDTAIFFVLPQFLRKLSTAFADFRVWVVDTRQRIEDSVRDVIDGAGLGLAIAGIVSILTEGAFDVLVGAAELLGIDVIGVLAGPIAELSAGAVATLEGAEVLGAVAGGVTAMAMAVERTPEPNIEQADTTKLGEELGERTGVIDQSESTFNQAERKIAERLAGEGHDVKALKPSTEPGVRTPDALLDGTPTEFKTIEATDPGSTKVMRVLDDSARKGGQAREIVVDAEGTSLTREAALEGVQRFKGLRKDAYDKIIIWGDGWTIVAP